MAKHDGNIAKCFLRACQNEALIVILEKCCMSLDLACNTKKTVCMVFDPGAKDKIVCKHFPNFSMGGQPLQFVTEFHYLGYIISNTLADDSDICREIRNMYTRTNMLICRFNKCSTVVKIRLFRSYCISVYGAGLWSSYSNALRLSALTQDMLSSMH